MERKRREGSLTHEDPDGEGEQSSFKHLRSHRCCSLAYWNRSVISSNKWLETEKTSNCTREAIILWHLTSTEMRERKWGGTRIWTRDLLICSQLLYHWAIPPVAQEWFYDCLYGFRPGPCDYCQSHVIRLGNHLLSLIEYQLLCVRVCQQYQRTESHSTSHCSMGHAMHCSAEQTIANKGSCVMVTYKLPLWYSRTKHIFPSVILNTNCWTLTITDTHTPRPCIVPPSCCFWTLNDKSQHQGTACVSRLSGCPGWVIKAMD